MARSYLHRDYVHHPVGLAAAGVPVLCADWGGVDTFGNDTARSRAESGRRFLQGPRMRAAPGRIFLVGMSMGALTALNYARLVGPSAIGSIALLTPPIDLTRLHQTSDEVARAIESAYGGSVGWDEMRESKDPARNTDELAGIPIGVWYSAADEVIPADALYEFRDRLPGTVELRPVETVGHAGAALSVSGSELAAWLRGTFRPPNAARSEDLSRRRRPGG